MTDMTTVPSDELARLKERARKLAQDKSYLQLIINLINKVSTAQGLENMIETLLNNILDVLGGANIVLYYLVDDDIYYADLFGKRMKLDRIDDELVKKAMDSGKPIEHEHDFGDTQMLTQEFSRAYTWVFPLLAGNERIGVIKLESLHIAMRELYGTLPTFFNYVASVLKNEIHSHTRLNQAYRELQERNFWLRETQRITRLGSYELDIPAGSWSCSETLYELFGIDDEYEKDIEGWRRLIHPDQREQMLNYFTTSVLECGQKFDKDYLIMRQSDHLERWVHGMGSLDFDDNGRPIRMFGTIQDITERKQTENKLQEYAAELTRSNSDLQKAYNELKETQSRLLQQDKMASIGQLAAGVAHEINNPMGFIISNLGSLGRYVEKLSAYLEFNEKLYSGCDASIQVQVVQERKNLKIDRICKDLPELISESLEGAERVRKIVQDLKSFSRIDNAEYANADINEGVESTLSIVWNELKYKATVQKEYGRLPLLRCNQGQLNQVFMNILVNAAQAIDSQGEIRIKTWFEGEMVGIAISDTGSGIAPENVKRIFDPFFTTKEVGKGTGLGLAIAYDIIVNKHGGSIEVKSEVGAGTTFTIMLPMKRDQNAHDAVTADEVGAGKNIHA